MKKVMESGRKGRGGIGTHGCSLEVRGRTWNFSTDGAGGRHECSLGARMRTLYLSVDKRIVLMIAPW